MAMTRGLCPLAKDVVIVDQAPPIRDEAFLAKLYSGDLKDAVVEENHRSPRWKRTKKKA
jgi:hypothetical protein